MGGITGNWLGVDVEATMEFSVSAGGAAESVAASSAVGLGVVVVGLGNWTFDEGFSSERPVAVR